MKLEEVMPNLRAGQAIFRRSWESGACLTWTESLGLVDEDGGGYAFADSDIEADDWESVAEPRSFSYVRYLSCHPTEVAFPLSSCRLPSLEYKHKYRITYEEI